MHPDKKRFPEFHPREPYFMPGYTGFCPRQPWIYGDTLGRATSRVMRLQPHIGGRLSPINFDMPSEHSWRAEGRLFGHIKERPCVGEIHSHWLHDYDKKKWDKHWKSAQEYRKEVTKDKAVEAPHDTAKSDDQKQSGKKTLNDILEEKGYCAGRISEFEWSDGEKVFAEYEPVRPVLNQVPYGGGILCPTFYSTVLKCCREQSEARHRARLEYQYQKRALEMGFEWERTEDEKHPNIYRQNDYLPRQREHYYPPQAYKLIPRPSYDDKEDEEEPPPPIATNVTREQLLNGHLLLKEGYLPRRGFVVGTPKKPYQYNYPTSFEHTGIQDHIERYV